MKGAVTTAVAGVAAIVAAALALGLHLPFLGLPLCLWRELHWRMGWARVGGTGFLVGAGLPGGLAFRAMYGPGEAVGE